MEFPHFLSALPAHEHVADEPFPESRRWPALGVLSAAMFISAVDMTIVNVALPDISQQLGAGIGELQWVMDGFLIALAGLLLVAGRGPAVDVGRLGPPTISLTVVEHAHDHGLPRVAGSIQPSIFSRGPGS